MTLFPWIMRKSDWWIDIYSQNRQMGSLENPTILKQNELIENERLAEVKNNIKC